jgi:YegS/Rv2252/BmrU family lipid kinase
VQARVVYNPSAGGKTTSAEVLAAVEELRAHGWGVDIAETARAGDGLRLARQAVAEKLDALIAIGGDGTLNEAANALVDSTTALGVLPRGTGNVWARELGMPLDDLAACARLLANARTHAIDVGEVRGNGFAPRVFVLWCGVGFDAAVTREIEPQRDLKRRFGKLFFAMVGLRKAWEYRGKRVRLHVDQKKLRRRVILAIAANVQLYAAIARIAPEAKLDDGALDLILFKGTGFAETALHFARVLLGLHLRDPKVEIHRVMTAHISGKKLPVQVDGEPIGFTPVDIRVRPRALRVLVPETANMSLFARPYKV